MAVDPVTLQVIQARLAGIVQEMQNSLFRTGYSTIIRESQDASCSIAMAKWSPSMSFCRCTWAPFPPAPRAF
jgi:N-methylhydantoinase B/oxoprolinase/acetone carboxylase alpha subunit